jgi:hypothetical protein
LYALKHLEGGRQVPLSGTRHDSFKVKESVNSRIMDIDIAWYRMLLASFLLYLFHSQTNVISISEEVIFWLILGIAK